MTNTDSASLRKIFIGGLSYSTDDDKLKKYFGAFGAVQDAVVMKDPISRRSRGFGFITYCDLNSVDNALANEPHTIDARKVEAKRAVPRAEGSKEGQAATSTTTTMSTASSVSYTAATPVASSSSSSSSSLVSNKSSSSSKSKHTAASIVSSNSETTAENMLLVPPSTSQATIHAESRNATDPRINMDEYAYNKVFVGGLHYDTRDAEFRQYFENYGKVITAEVMFNRETHKSRGFGFIVFEQERGAENVCLVKEHIIDGKVVEVKRAIPRSKLPPPALSSNIPSSSSSSPPSLSGSTSKSSVISASKIVPCSKSATAKFALTSTAATKKISSNSSRSTPTTSYAAALKLGDDESSDSLSSNADVDVSSTAAVIDDDSITPTVFGKARLQPRSFSESSIHFQGVANDSSSSRTATFDPRANSSDGIATSYIKQAFPTVSVPQQSYLPEAAYLSDVSQLPAATVAAVTTATSSHQNHSAWSNPSDAQQQRLRSSSLSLPWLSSPPVGALEAPSDQHILPSTSIDRDFMLPLPHNSADANMPMQHHNQYSDIHQQLQYQQQHHAFMQMQLNSGVYGNDWGYNHHDQYAVDRSQYYNQHFQYMQQQQQQRPNSGYQGQYQHHMSASYDEVAQLSHNSQYTASSIGAQRPASSSHLANETHDIRSDDLFTFKDLRSEAAEFDPQAIAWGNTATRPRNGGGGSI